MMLSMHIFALNAMVGTASLAIFGPLPYTAVVIIVEIMKIVAPFNLGILNFSRVVQIILVIDCGYLLQVLLIISIPG